MRQDDKLAEKEKFLNDIFDSIRDGISVLDKDLNILLVNATMEKWYGKHITGRKCYDAYHGRTSPCEVCPSLRAIKEKSTQHEVVHDLRGWSEIFSFPMFDDKGNVTGVIEHVRDVDERKRAEDALRESEARLRRTEKILYRSQVAGKVGSWYLDLENDRLWWSPETYHIFGIPSGRPMDYGAFLSKVYEEDRPRVDKAWKAALKGSPYEVEHRIVVDDKIKWVFEKAVLDFDRYGQPVSGIGTVLDITDSKRASLALKESEERYRNLVENINDWVWEINAGGVYTYASPKVRELLGYEPHELMGLTPFDLMSPDEAGRMKVIFAGIMEKRASFDLLENTLLRKDGTPIVIEVSGKPIFDAAGAFCGYQGIGRDITERKYVKQELEEAKARAELYLDLMGHDINNMNQVGLGYLELALDTLDLDENGRMIIQKSAAAMENSSRLIENVKKLQRARSGEMRLREIDLGQILGDVVAYHSGVRDGVTIHNEASTGSRVMANDLLNDVFSNLIGNAIKHSKETLEINIRLARVVDKGRPGYRVIIEDNGPGIPDELKGRIFDRFQRGSTSAKGRGLGLYLVRSLVESYGGRVWVEDRVPGDHKKGSRFIVQLPAAPSAGPN